jgi:hypothetical protein
LGLHDAKRGELQVSCPALSSTALSAGCICRPIAGAIHRKPIKFAAGATFAAQEFGDSTAFLPNRPGTRLRAGAMLPKLIPTYLVEQQACSGSAVAADFAVHLPEVQVAAWLAAAPQQPDSAQQAQSQTPVTSQAQPFASQAHTAQAQESPQQEHGACCPAEPKPIEPSSTSKAAQ